MRVGGDSLFLKPSNLLPAKELGGMPTNVDEAKEMAQEYASELSAKLKMALPPGIEPRDLAFAVAGLALLWKTAGFVRAFAIAAVLATYFLGGGVDAYTAAGGGIAGARAASDAAGEFVAKRASERLSRPVTARQAQAGMMLLLVLAAALGGRSAAPAPAYPSSFPVPEPGSADDAAAGVGGDAAAGGDDGCASAYFRRADIP